MIPYVLRAVSRLENENYNFEGVCSGYYSTHHIIVIGDGFGNGRSNDHSSGDGYSVGYTHIFSSFGVPLQTPSLFE